jgi:hypothetical protein
MEFTMAETTIDTQARPEEVVFFIPWEEKRKEFPNPPANEGLVGQTWDMYENLMFFYLMWLGTY